MPDDQNTIKNQDSEKSSIPMSPQETVADIPVFILDSTPADMPPEAPETPKNVDNTIPVNNDNPGNAPQTTENKDKIAENWQNVENILLEPTDLPANPASNGTSPETPIFSESVKAPETRTGQTPVSDPLSSTNEPLPTSIESSSDTKSEQVEIPETKTEPKSISESKPEPIEAKAVPVLASVSLKLSQKDLWKRFLDKVQIGKRKKLEKIMTLFLKHKNITNDEVEKFLRVSDKTAERYLNILEKENKIKQNGKTGHAVSYSKII